MNYQNFARHFKNFSYFKADSLSTLEGNPRTLRNQIVLWQRQGKVRMLKKGIYTLNDDDRRVPLPGFLISNILYPPSYVGLESALSYYDLIPERVAMVTAVGVRKTTRYENFYGLFLYRSFQRRKFFGFTSVLEEGVPVLMARAEKAILDKVYFDPSFEPHEDYFLDHLRLQNFDILSRRRLKEYAGRFDSKKVRAAASLLTDLIRKEKP